jgi:hypothetical protein
MIEETKAIVAQITVEMPNASYDELEAEFERRLLEHPRREEILKAITKEIFNEMLPLIRRARSKS